MKVRIVDRVVSFMLLSMFLYTACGTSNNSPVSYSNFTPAPVPAEYSGKTNPVGFDELAQGAEIYKNNCSACHGESGRGDGTAGQVLDPKPANLFELQKMVGDDYLFWRINSGKEGTSMVAWKGVLRDEQIWRVISYIHSLK